jgi:N-methylhydantoinase B
MGRVLDPITLEILWRRLISIVDEADSSVAELRFFKSAQDAHDYTCMFTDRKGRELAQGASLPHGSRAHGAGIKNLINIYPLSTIPPVCVITNDPWALAVISMMFVL